MDTRQRRVRRLAARLEHALVRHALGLEPRHHLRLVLPVRDNSLLRLVVQRVERRLARVVLQVFGDGSEWRADLQARGLKFLFVCRLIRRRRRALRLALRLGRWLVINGIGLRIVARLQQERLD